MELKICSRVVKTILAACLGVTIFAGCAEDKRTEPQRPTAFVSILPHAYFAQRIGGEHFDIETLIATGQDPHNFSPTPGQTARLSNAQLYFRAGIDFEDGLMPKIKRMSRHLTIVDLRDGIRMREFEESAEGRDHDHSDETHGHSDETHGHSDTHDHSEDAGDIHHQAGEDPHIWLSPVLAKKQAQTIRDAFIKADPQAKATYERNFDSLAADLDSLDTYLKDVLAPVKGSKLFVYHPSFGYFADQYGLQQVAVETGGKEPSARALTRLIDLAKKEKVKVIFVQPQFSQKSARALAAQMDGAVVSINPLPSNYLWEMRGIGLVVKDAIVE